MPGRLGERKVSPTPNTAMPAISPAAASVRLDVWPAASTTIHDAPNTSPVTATARVLRQPRTSRRTKLRDDDRPGVGGEREPDDAAADVGRARRPRRERRRDLAVAGDDQEEADGGCGQEARVADDRTVRGDACGDGPFPRRLPHLAERRSGARRRARRTAASTTKSTSNASGLNARIVPAIRLPIPEAEVDRAVAHAEHVLAPAVVDGVDEEREHPDPHDAETGSLEAGRHDCRRRGEWTARKPSVPAPASARPATAVRPAPNAVGRHPGRDRAHEAGRARDGEREAGCGEADPAAVVQEDDHDRQRHPRADLEEEDAAEEPPGAGAERREERFPGGASGRVAAVEDDLVPVRVAHERHVADAGVERLHVELTPCSSSSRRASATSGTRSAKPDWLA